ATPARLISSRGVRICILPEAAPAHSSIAARIRRKDAAMTELRPPCPRLTLGHHGPPRCPAEAESPQRSNCQHKESIMIARPSRQATVFATLLVTCLGVLFAGLSSPEPLQAADYLSFQTQDEANNIEIFKAASPSVVYVTNSALRRDFYSFNIQEI